MQMPRHRPKPLKVGLVLDMGPWSRGVGDPALRASRGLERLLVVGVPPQLRVDVEEAALQGPVGGNVAEGEPPRVAWILHATDHFEIPSQPLFSGSVRT